MASNVSSVSSDPFLHETPYVEEKAASARKRRRVPPTLRKRAIRACCHCRNIKLRCDGLQPCERCRKNNLDCDYPVTKNSKKPAGLSNAYVAELEERQIYLEYIFQRRLPELNLNTNTLRRFSLQLKQEELGERNGTEPSLEILTPRTGEGSHVDQGRNDDLEEEEEEEGEEGDEEEEDEEEQIRGVMQGQGSLICERQDRTHYLGESAGWAFLDNIRKSLTTDNQTLDVPTEYRRLLAANDSHHVGCIHSSEIGAILPPNAVIDFLIDTFMKHCQFDLFYCNETSFRQQVARTRASLEIRSGDPVFLCFFLMVLAVASEYGEIESQSQLQKRGPGSITSGLQSRDSGAAFYNAACTLLPQVITSCTVTGVQACLLMGIYLQWTNKRDISYICTGLALRMAISSGIHRRCTNHNLDPLIVQVRTRVWWSIYIVDRFASGAMGRPLSIRDCDFDVEPPKYFPALDTPRFIAALQIMQAKIGLARVYGNIVTKIYTIPKMPNDGPYVSKKDLLELKEELSTWKGSLPPRVFQDGLGLQQPPMRQEAHLRLAYYQAKILLTRPFLLYLVRTRNRPFPESRPERETLRLIQRLSDDCVDVAHDSLKLITKLHDSGQLCRLDFWDYHYCCAGVNVMLLRCILSRNETEITAAQTGMRIMEYIAKVNDSAKLALSMMHQLMNVLDTIESERLQREEEGRAAMKPDTGFQAWQRWISNGQLHPTSPESSMDTSHPDSTETEYAPRMQQDIEISAWPDLLDASPDGTIPLLGNWQDDGSAFNLFDFQGMNSPESMLPSQSAFVTNDQPKQFSPSTDVGQD